MSCAPRPRVASSHIAIRVCPLADPRCVSPPCTAPSRRLCTHRSTLAPTCRPDVRAPTFRHPREHPETFCVAQLRHSARSDYNSMDEWGSVQYGGAIQMAASARAHRMPVPWVHSISNPPHRSVCPCTVSHLLAPAMSRTYVISLPECRNLLLEGYGTRPSRGRWRRRWPPRSQWEPARGTVRPCAGARPVCGRAT